MSIRKTKIYRYGQCRNCGECCRTLFISGDREVCPHYDDSNVKHCLVYGNRPKACREYPRGSTDLDRVTNCGFWFADYLGRRVDGYMDKRVRLTKVGQIR